MMEQTIRYNSNNAFSIPREILVPYKTESDAMLASLVTAHSVSLEAMDLFLTVLRSPNFHPDQISLKSINQITKPVIACRQQEILEKSYNVDANAARQGLLLRLVLDDLMNSREYAIRLFQETRFAFSHRKKDVVCVQQVLLSLARVHTSWTEPSLRALGRSLIFLDPTVSQILSPLSSPAFGDWTKDVTFVFTARYDEESVWVAVDRLFSALPSIRTICLVVSLGLSDNLESMTRTVNHLSSTLHNLNSLEELSLYRAGPRWAKPAGSPPLFDALHLQPDFRRLTLDRFIPLPYEGFRDCSRYLLTLKQSTDVEEQMARAEYEPNGLSVEPSRLTALARCCHEFAHKVLYNNNRSTFDLVQRVSFDRTSSRSPAFSVASMTIADPFKGERRFNMRSVEPYLLLDNISALEIAIWNPTSDIESKWVSFIANKPLRFLKLECFLDEFCTFDAIKPFFDALPRTLKDLLIAVVVVRSTDEGQHPEDDNESYISPLDKNLAEYVKKTDQLQTLHIHLRDQNASSFLAENSPESFPKTQSECGGRRVEMTAGTYNIYLPYTFHRLRSCIHSTSSEAE